MPATNENIPEKAKFDVYAMLIILTFVFTLGSTLMLNDDLDKNWNFWAEPQPEKAVHLTEMNDDPASEYVIVREIDRKEWDLAMKSVHGTDQNFTVSGYEWPAGYDVKKYPVKPGANNLELIPEEQRNALLAGYAKSSEPAAAPAAPAAPAPAPEAPAAPVAQ